jgi:catalase
VAQDELAERLVESLNASYGVHDGHRAAHAKGVLCAATFHPSSAASGLSRASHFVGPPVRAHVRFSNGSGNPTVADGVRDGRGMAVKFYLADGTTTDLVALSLPAFFARTPDDLLAFNAARQPDPATGQPDLARVGEYLAAHPEAMTAVNAALAHPIPASYAEVAYHGLHAFGFVSADDSIRWGRYHLEPSDGVHDLTDEQAATKPEDFLREELTERLGRGPASFRIRVQLAGEGDSIEDPTQTWPDERDVVDVGELAIEALAFDREQDGDVLVFDPTRVTDGLVLSDDPILHARSRAYRASVARRTA